MSPASARRREGACVAGSAAVTQVMDDVLEAGGNAVDAGVAGCVASVVVQPDQCNLGGIVPMTILPAGHVRPIAIGGVGSWSHDVRLAAVVERYGGELPRGGARAVVPAALASWTTALARFGTMTFREVAAPALALARGGVVVDAQLASSLRAMGRVFAGWDSTSSVYWPDGSPPEVGERLMQADLAGLLAWLVDAEGRGSRDRTTGLRAVRDAFYRGDVARCLAEFVVADGGWMTAQDLARFEVSVDPAPSITFRGATVWSPPGYTQGPVLLETLRLVELLDLGRLTEDARSAHLMIEAINAAFWDRERLCGDPRAGGHGLEALLSAERLASVAASIGDKATVAPPSSGVRSTVAVCVIDSTGNVFSATPSDTLDGGPIVEGLGILCSPRGAQSRTVDGHPNRVFPGGRPCVTPSPAILRHERDGTLIAVASAGGDMIVQSMVQVLHELLVDPVDLYRAVEAPRLGVFTFPDAFSPNRVDGSVRLEERFPAEVRQALADRGHRIAPWTPFDADAAAVAMVVGTPRPGGRGLGRLRAAADRRREYVASCR